MRCITQRFIWQAALLFCLTIAASAVAAPLPTATQPLDEPLEVLSPRSARTEQDNDRLAAAAHFAAGRMLEQRQMLPQALRQYERAIRYDPDATPVLRELVPLAFTIDRPDEGLRYAVKYIDQTEVDDAVLARAAEFLAEAGEWQRALKLYQHLARSLAKEKASPQQVAVQMQLGRLYFLNGQYADSAAAFKQVMDALEQPKQAGLDTKSRRAILGDDGAIYELFAAAFLEAKQPENARTAYERFNQWKPDVSAFALNMARVELAADNPQAALDELQKYFGAGAAPKSIAPYESLAKTLKKLKQDDELIPRLEKLYAAQPKNTLLAYFLGQQYREAGNLEKAQPLLEASLAEKPAEQSYEALIDIDRRTNQPKPLLKLLAQVAEKSGSLTNIDKNLQEIVKDEKLLAAILDAAQKQHAGATADDHYPLRVAALLAAEAKQWSEAEKLFNLAITADPKSASELLLVWGLGLLMDNKPAKAGAVFQRGIDEKVVKDDNPAFYYYLAGALEMQGKTDEALIAAKAAAGKQPKNPEMAARPAWILYHAKRYDKAFKAYRDLIEKFEDDYTTDGVRDTLRQAREALSNICLQNGEDKQAVDCLEQVLDEFPDDPGANNDLGYLWADRNEHLHRAEAMTQMAVAAEPDNFAYRDSLGWALFRLGRLGEALNQLQKAASSEKPDGEVLAHIAEVQAKLGHAAEAKAAWTSAAEAFKQAGETEKLKAVEKKLEPRAPKPE